MWREPVPVTGGDAVSYLELATLPSAPFWARRQTCAVLRAWGMSSEVIETTELLVSELVTNAAKFTAPASQQHYSDLDGVEIISLTLRYLRSSGCLVAEVFDTGPSLPVLAGPDEDAEGGRGLMLVQALSKEWGHYQPPTGGKVVYCLISTG